MQPTKADKFNAFLKKLPSNEIVALTSLLAALLYNVWLTFIKDPFNTAITHMIRDDLFFNYDLLIAWALITGFAFFCNIHRLSARTRVHKTFSRMSKGLIFAAFVSIILSSLLSTQDMDNIHAITAGAFAAFSLLSIFILGLGAMLKSVRYFILMSVEFYIIYIMAMLILELRQMAMWEDLPIIQSLVFFLIANFTDFFKLKEKLSKAERKLRRKQKRQAKRELRKTLTDGDIQPAQEPIAEGKAN
ncbi:MAG: hypothetical protein LBQ40_04670 [Clostridiales bacterium]|jgi:hypothetical protein|nr:hypothetical protein [Clostridiales bacterium]